ncbi:hypothetical protein OIU84_021048 [Salix udensis]|uniref:non-specific serine/threonine protein kinase n=1 Tax=Salix udensis TaxID=889485 RepID=A0AAD6PH15_9ROSI|nr:hypothetical protein OIU84_021048 [Salix udensis]
MYFTPAPVITFKMSLFVILTLQPLLTLSLATCRTSCGSIAINYPFGIDDGCGAPQFRHMLNCSTDLFFLTPSGGYKVQHIDYEKKTMIVYDPAMSTCSILQPHHDFVMSDIQSVTIPPTPDTVFVLLNCSIDSPFMSMNILDCSHYTTVINTDSLMGISPLDWVYGIKLSYSVPETGCERCSQSGGTCGYDTETEGMTCLCSSFSNYTRECAGGSLTAGDHRSSHCPLTFFNVAILLVLSSLLVI